MMPASMGWTWEVVLAGRNKMVMLLSFKPLKPIGCTGSASSKVWEDALSISSSTCNLQQWGVVEYGYQA